MATTDHQYLQAAGEFVQDNERLRKFVIIGPPVLFLILFFLFPLLSIIGLSFLNGMPPASFTLENYAQIVSTGGLYFGVLQRSIFITVITTLLVTALGYTFAYSIVRFSRWTSMLLLLVVLPFWINYVVRMYAWINILQDGGVLNWIETTIGIASGSTGYLYSLEAVLVGMVYIYLPLATFPFYASIKGMDDNMIQAAKDLGAGPVETFVRVTLPMTRNGLLAGMILVAIPAFGAFITPSMLGGTSESMIGMVIEIQFNQAFDWPLGAALSVVVTALVVITVVVGSILGANVLRRDGGE